MIADPQEAAVLESIVPQLQAEGFEVYTHPSPPLLPPFMRGHAPDAIAIREGRKLAVEVVREGPSSKGRLDKVQKLLAGRKDWELRVYWVSPATAPKPIAPASRESIEQSIATIEELTAHDRIGPALLMAWATLEALGRALQPDTFARPQTPGRLVEHLAASGQITPSEAARLRRMAEIRNQLAHGGLQMTVAEPEMRAFIEILKTLLRLLPEPSLVG